MTDTQMSAAADPEIAAISVVYRALDSLEPPAQVRVLTYVAGKLGISVASEFRTTLASTDAFAERERAGENGPTPAEEPSPDSPDEVSPVAQKWMKRNGLNAADLEKIFSIGGDEVDLIAKTVPGKSKRERMHSVLLLKGVAAYIGTGVARVSDQQIRETCLHYDAFDSANFAASLKKLAADVSGTKQSGYTLTPRGLAAATDLVKATIGSPN